MQYLAVDKLVKKFNEENYEIDEKDKNVLLTNEGIDAIEKLFTNIGNNEK